MKRTASEVSPTAGMPRAKKKKDVKLHSKVRWWANQCSFKCGLCKDFETTTSKLTLANHVVSRHGMRFEVYGDKFMEKSILFKEVHR